MCISVHKLLSAVFCVLALASSGTAVYHAIFSATSQRMVYHLICALVMVSMSATASLAGYMWSKTQAVIQENDIAE